jgi:hypothetical protein
MDIAGCALAEQVDDPLIDFVVKSDGVDRREFGRLLEQNALARLRGTGLADPCLPRAGSR